MRQMSSVVRRIAIAFLLTLVLAVQPLGTVQPQTATHPMNGNPEATPRPAVIDLDRVTWQTNQIPYGDMESWDNAHTPSDGLAYRSTEKFGWYAKSPWPVKNGTQSLGMQVRTLDPLRHAEFRVTQQSWAYWSGATNVTLRMNYYIDQIPAPGDGDALYVQVEMGSPHRTMYYYLAGTTSSSNDTYHGYIVLNSPVGQWLTMSRNVTQDYIDVFGEPSTEFRLFHIYLVGVTATYVRSFIDDVYLANGTLVKIGGSQNFGDFEPGGTGSAWYWSNSDPSTISQSSLSAGGSWSMNLTTLSNGNSSLAYWNVYPGKLLTNTNPGYLSLNWRLEDYQPVSKMVGAYMMITYENRTGEDFTMFYYFAYGDSLAGPGGGAVSQFVDNANHTGAWHYVQIDLFHDLRRFNITEELYIRRIEFRTYAIQHNARIVLLIDNLALVAPTTNDPDFEDQPPVGEMATAWSGGSILQNPHLTVTNVSVSGEKALNLTVTGGDSFSEMQSFGELELNNRTELFIDWNWWLWEFTNLTDDVVILSVYTDEFILGYVMGNGSDAARTGGCDGYLMVDSAGMTDGWHNAQRDIYKDYKTVFGTDPNTTISGIYLTAYSDSDGNVTLLLDDLYIYEDPAPTLENLTFDPSRPTPDNTVWVNVSAYDPNLETVMLHYRVDGGAWTNVTMVEIESEYTASIPAQPLDSLVEFYVSAQDSYGKVTTLLNGTDYFQYQVVAATTPTTTTNTTTSTATTPPTTTTTTETGTTTISPAGGGALLLVAAGAAAVAVALVVVFVLRKRRGA